MDFGERHGAAKREMRTIGLFLYLLQLKLTHRTHLSAILWLQCHLRHKCGAVVCSAQDFERPILTADVSIARYAQSYVDRIAARPGRIDDKVRDLIVALLSTGHCSVERVAEHRLCDRCMIHRRPPCAARPFPSFSTTNSLSA
jgi:hypothetical protein